MKRICFCEDCRYMFPAPVIPGQCPDCGGKHVRKASIMETEEYRRLRKIILEEIRLGVIPG